MTTAEMLRAEGEARGKAEDILVVFEQRGIDVDERSRELIESCTDLDTLNGWFRRAFKVDKASGTSAAPPGFPSGLPCAWRSLPSRK